MPKKVKQMLPEVTDSLFQDEQFMAIAAFRYCLPRRSTAPSTCRDWLLAVWDRLLPTTQSTIYSDLVGYLMSESTISLGDVTEYRLWTEWSFFAKSLEKKMTPEQLEFVRILNEWRRKPWPVGMTVEAWFSLGAKVKVTEGA